MSPPVGDPGRRPAVIFEDGRRRREAHRRRERLERRLARRDEVFVPKEHDVARSPSRQHCEVAVELIVQVEHVGVLVRVDGPERIQEARRGDLARGTLEVVAVLAHREVPRERVARHDDPDVVVLQKVLPGRVRSEAAARALPRERLVLPLRASSRVGPLGRRPHVQRELVRLEFDHGVVGARIEKRAHAHVLGTITRRVAARVAAAADEASVGYLGVTTEGRRQCEARLVSAQSIPRTQNSRRHALLSRGASSAP
eukprot:CAMPEP_0185691896 /NCGR_PEP_ID=MMETSP1164-20130828/2164_1 /TAXON_ID=1104430 /ORGANISM="Chrysoreinhardia sp, Strain CCMP2950" /LENGTH=255 /DNA_ID=CAMNT_0028358599 /DNA_START=182 /DNA_END=945 /DNA_ORIENTATION=-